MTYFIVRRYEDYMILYKHFGPSYDKIIMLRPNFKLWYNFKDKILTIDNCLKQADIEQYRLFLNEKSGIFNDNDENIEFPFLKIFWPSIRLTLGSIWLYWTGFFNLLSSDDTLCYTDNDEMILHTCIIELKKIVGFKTKFVRNQHDYTRFFEKRRNFIFDNTSNFYCKKFIWKIINIVKEFFLSDAKKKKVVFLGAGKEKYITTWIKNVLWYTFNVKQLLIQKRCFLVDINTIKYEETTLPNNYFNIKEMICKNIAIFSHYDRIFKLVLEQYEKHFIQAYNYFIATFNFLKEKSISVLLIGTNVHENHLVPAYAAKLLGIPVVFYAHGLGLWGNKCADDLISKYFVQGKYQMIDHLAKGVQEDKIIELPLPWFITKKRSVEKKILYKQGLILVDDYSELFPYRIEKYFSFLEDIIQVFKKLSIEIVGLKFRSSETAMAYGFEEYVEILDSKLKVYAGYGGFSDFADQIQVAVGPLCSAFLESCYLGIDYYVYENQDRMFAMEDYHAIRGFINISTTQEELITAIKDRKPFKESYTCESIIDLNFDEAKFKKNFNMILE